MNEKLHFHKDGTYTKCPNWDICIETGNKALISEFLEDLKEIEKFTINPHCFLPLKKTRKKIKKWENK